MRKNMKSFNPRVQARVVYEKNTRKRIRCTNEASPQERLEGKRTKEQNASIKKTERNMTDATY